MSQFEFFMTFYSLLVGIGVAELLLGFMNLLRQRQRPRLGLLTPLLGLAIFLQLMALFIDAWLSLKDVEITMVGLAVPTLIAICMLAASVLVFPRDPQDWPDLTDYFFRNRRIALGLMFAANLLVLVHEHTKVRMDQLPPYITVNLIGFALTGSAALVRSRAAAAISLVLLIGMLIGVYSGSHYSPFKIISRLLT